MYTYYSISDKCLSINNSYEVNTKARMNEVLDTIREMESKKTHSVLNRTNKNMIEEWRAHNLLYKLHIFRSHTRDVDLEYPQKWYFKIAYKILSLF